ncbi:MULTISPECIES: transporter [unclassified Rhodanobacter]|uniref:transporter n=1 Tax=unclassified Rhodanobacter TaxID=2621553 RepID=UPI001BDE23A2|nr:MULTISPECIES: transporter [unclassified Rhodanobacter]MBT2142481.1 transporter [Rhodanobacter sp. LX-99]MBT2148446.1 transporter [Rhodanobacter sp. LX-100]
MTMHPEAPRTPHRRCLRRLAWSLSCAALLPLVALAQDVPSRAVVPLSAASMPRQSQDDAWWTGPMLANSAATLPRGHILIEPYVYDVSSPHADGYGSLTYMLYGLTDRLTVGLVPVLGYNRMDGPGDSSGIGLGDVSVQAQYRLTDVPAGSSRPTVSLQLQETLPTGKYDRLGRRPGNGLGSGATTTTLQVNTQTYFWLSNGRILRMRFNVAKSFSTRAQLEDASVYGTPDGFRGHARPGSSFFVNAAWEYSLSQRWVLALDVTYRRSHGARVRGHDLHDAGGLPALRLDGRSSEAFGFAPAIEYSWSPTLGVLFGTRVITGGHNTATTITPAVAFNYVH